MTNSCHLICYTPQTSDYIETVKHWETAFFVCWLCGFVNIVFNEVKLFYYSSSEKVGVTRDPLQVLVH